MIQFRVISVVNFCIATVQSLVIARPELAEVDKMTSFQFTSSDVALLDSVSCETLRVVTFEDLEQKQSKLEMSLGRSKSLTGVKTGRSAAGARDGFDASKKRFSVREPKLDSVLTRDGDIFYKVVRTFPSIPDLADEISFSSTKSLLVQAGAVSTRKSLTDKKEIDFSLETRCCIEFLHSGQKLKWWGLFR